MPKLYVIIWGLFLLLGLSGFSAFGQAAEATVSGAETRYNAGDYYGALFEYERAMQVDSTNLAVLVGYGKTLLAINDPKKASIYLKKAKALDSKKSIENLGYLVAESFRLAGDYRNARKYYSLALTAHNQDKDGYWYQRISISKEANTWATKQPISEKKLTHFGPEVNSNFSEFGAQVFDGNLYFSALIADSVGASNVLFDKDHYAKLYVTSEDGTEEKREIILSNRDQNAFQQKHLTNPSFLGNQLFFTACDSNYNCEIYRGKISNNRLVAVKKLSKNINNTVSNNTQPHAVVEKFDTILYFVSDRKLGFGGLDIWRSKKETFGFGQAINVGNEINSADNEISPFFDVQGHHLYFSSNWHIGYGGYDIFKSEKQGNNFKSPENIGQPYNSSYHDYYFFPFKKEAILSSNRPTDIQEEACCNDLYKSEYEREIMKESEKITKLAIVETKVNEEVLNKFLPLSLYFHNNEPKPNSSDTSTNSNFQNLSNDYLSIQFDYFSKYVSNLDENEKQIQTAKLNSFFSEKLLEGTNQLKELTPLLLKELEKGNSIELAVRGYASPLSSEEYNLKLTLRRIQSLINYLQEVEGGAIRKYLDNKSLIINKLPLGEYAATESQERDELSAIYSYGAALERKIELIALKSSDKNTGLQVTEEPNLSIKKTKHIAIYRKGSVVKREFILDNNGSDTLKIYQTIVDSKIASTNQPQFVLPQQSEKLIVEIFTSQLVGTTKVEAILVTNDPFNNIRKLEVELKPIN